MCGGPLVMVGVAMGLLAAALHFAGWRDAKALRFAAARVPLWLLELLSLDWLALPPGESVENDCSGIVMRRAVALFGALVAIGFLGLGIAGFVACVV